LDLALTQSKGKRENQYDCQDRGKTNEQDHCINHVLYPEDVLQQPVDNVGGFDDLIRCLIGDIAPAQDRAGLGVVG
jgi:hypothetical protein